MRKGVFEALNSATCEARVATVDLCVSMLGKMAMWRNVKKLPRELMLKE